MFKGGQYCLLSTGSYGNDQILNRYLRLTGYSMPKPCMRCLLSCCSDENRCLTSSCLQMLRPAGEMNPPESAFRGWRLHTRGSSPGHVFPILYLQIYIDSSIPLTPAINILHTLQLARKESPPNPNAPTSNLSPPPPPQTMSALQISVPSEYGYPASSSSIAHRLIRLKS